MTIRRSGHVALIGRPNTGKSTLLNRLVGMPLSITADRPQTTRHRILGLLAHGDAQIAFVDSPGFQTLRTNPLNRLLNRTAHSVARQADVVVLVARSLVLEARPRPPLPDHPPEAARRGVWSPPTCRR